MLEEVDERLASNTRQLEWKNLSRGTVSSNTHSCSKCKKKDGSSRLMKSHFVVMSLAGEEAEQPRSEGPTAPDISVHYLHNCTALKVPRLSLGGH